MSAFTVADVCCCGGLAADGYVMAGGAPHGFDIAPQPHYPYPFTLGDLLDLIPSGALAGYDLWHFSPPCQDGTRAGHLRAAQGGASRFPDLLTPTLALLRRHAHSRPWVVENVGGSRKVRAIMEPRPGEHLVTLCGSMFGLHVQRHRLFLANFPLTARACDHKRFPVDPSTGKPRPWGVYHVANDRVPSGGRTALDVEHGRRVMGTTRDLPWDTLKEGFPPHYTAHIGADFREHLAAW